MPGRHGIVPIRTYATAGASSGKAPFIWIHGGEFISGGHDQRESHAVAVELARRGQLVVTIDYRLAPPIAWRSRRIPLDPTGNHYPLPLDDVVDVIHHVTRLHGRISLGGASAGACLAASAILRLRDAGNDRPDLQAFAYGSFHQELPAATDELRARVRGLHRLGQIGPREKHLISANYLGGAPADEYAFAGDGATLSGFHPSLFIDADRDLIRASSSRFSTQLRGAGNTVESGLVARSRHGFFDQPHSAAF